MTTGSTPDLNEQIASLVKQRWTEHQAPLLLSQLGNYGNGMIATQARQYASSLEAYLRDRLPDQVEVIKHSSKPHLVGAIPKDVEVQASGDVDALLEKTQDRPRDATPHFQRAFWTAFRKPLEKERNRYLSVNEPVQFVDSDSKDTPAGFVGISAEYIADSDADDVEIQRRAQEWIIDNGFQQARFLVTRKRSIADNLLDRILCTLDHNERARITMPLDVVLKLRNTAL